MCSLSNCSCQIRYYWSFSFLCFSLFHFGGSFGLVGASGAGTGMSSDLQGSLCSSKQHVSWYQRLYSNII